LITFDHKSYFIVSPLDTLCERNINSTLSKRYEGESISHTGGVMSTLKARSEHINS